MGSAGLDLKSLTGMLERIRVDCCLLDGDKSEDHCLLRLTSVRRPGYEAILEYENHGTEPRVVTITVERASRLPSSKLDQFLWVSDERMKLTGPQKDDPEKIVELVKELFL